MSDAAENPNYYSVSFRPTEADFAAMMDRYWRLTPYRIWSIRVTIAFVIGVGVWAAYQGWQIGSPVLGVAALLLLLSPILAPYFNRKGYAKAFKRQRVGEVDAVVTVDETGASAVSTLSNQSFPWTSIGRVDKTKDHAFIWVNPYLAIMLPAAAFSDRATFDRAVDFCKARVQGQAF